MGLACVEALDEESRAEAEKFAQLWQVPMRESFAGATGVKAVFSSSALGLGFVDQKRGKPYYCDFQTRNWRMLLQGGLSKSHIFRRALGLKTQPLKVLDATAGFGQDALMALAAGCEVTALERSPVVSAVLQDGLKRAQLEDERWTSALKRFQLHQAEGVDFLTNLKDPIDVIYLDPMFDKPKKSAKSPKEMQLLQELLEAEHASANQELLAAAIAKARQRVVVKCPLKSRALGANPAHSFKGQSVRYDIYLRT